MTLIRTVLVIGYVLLGLAACDPTSDLDDILTEPPGDPSRFVCVPNDVGGLTCSPRPQP